MNTWCNRKCLGKKMDAQIKFLNDWMTRNHLEIEAKYHLKLIKSQNESEGRCVIATQNIDPDQVLFEIPVNFMLNYRFSLADSDLVKFFEWCMYEKNIKFTRLEALYFYLIVQKYQQDSFFHDFIKSMPITYDTPEYFDPILIDHLPFDLKPQVIKRLTIFEDKFRVYSALVKEFNESIDSKSFQVLADNFSYSTYKWIFCSVNSRCFHIDEAKLATKEEIELGKKLFGNLKDINKQFKKASAKIKSYDELEKSNELEQAFNNNQCCLIPFIDFLNHSFKSNAYAAFEESTKCYTLKSNELEPDEDTETIELKKVKENKQIYITYGYHDNRTLLIEYGFILEENIYDKIIPTKTDFIDLLKDLDDSESLWSQAGSLNLFNDISLNKAEGPSWYLLKMLDIISCLNSIQKENTNPKAKKLKMTVDIVYNVDIQSLFIQLLTKYKQNFNESIKNLLELKSNDKYKLNNYHVETVLKYIELQIDIVDFNLKLANDKDSFVALF